MNRVLLASSLIGLMGVTTWAQQEADSPAQRGERHPQTDSGRSAWAERIFGRFADELDLDDEQRAQFDEITAAHRERMRDVGRRWMEVRQAMRDGDEQRAAQLRAELPERPGPGSGIATTLDEIEPILREDQVAKLWEIQDRMQSHQESRERHRSILGDLPDELELDPVQRAEFKRIIDAQRRQMHERWSELRPLLDEMREANESGDREHAAELRTELEEARPNPANMFPALFEELELVLSEEQKERLAAFRQRMEAGDADESRGPEDVRNVLRAARRLKLDSEQKDDVREIEREAVKAYRKIGRRDREEQRQLAAEVKKEIGALLDAEQAEQFEQQLQRLERRSGKDRDR